MQNPPDTDYFIYIYVFTCEKCNCPHLETVIYAQVPKDEIQQAPSEWFCENCNSPQSTAAGYRSAGYAKLLSVKNGKCLERSSTGM